MLLATQIRINRRVIWVRKSCLRLWVQGEGYVIGPSLTSSTRRTAAVGQYAAGLLNDPDRTRAFINAVEWLWICASGGSSDRGLVPGSDPTSRSLILPMLSGCIIQIGVEHQDVGSSLSGSRRIVHKSVRCRSLIGCVPAGNYSLVSLIVHRNQS